MSDMPGPGSKRRLTAANVLAVVALLLTLGAQLVESVHFHLDNEPVSACIQCQASAGPALLSSHPELALFSLVGLFYVALATSGAIVKPASFQPRGPPQYS